MRGVALEGSRELVLVRPLRCTDHDCHAAHLRTDAGTELVLAESFEESASVAQRARIIASIAHPNLGRIREISRSGALVVSDFIEGEPLDALFDSPLPLGVALRIVIDVLAGLSALHDAKVVHGRVSARNVIVASNGVSKLVHGHLPAPDGDRSIDIAAAGSLLYELTLPLERARWAVPLGDVIEKALSPRPQETAAELAAAIRLIARARLAMAPDVADHLSTIAHERVSTRRGALAVGSESRLKCVPDGDAPLAPGKLVLDRFRLESLLEHGPTSSVWRAQHVELEQPVAVKTLPEGNVPDGVRRRFELEAVLASRLSRITPHVPAVIDRGQEGPMPILVMELLEGEPLDSLMDRGPSPLSTVAHVIGQAARGLHHAHRENVIHRDLHPGNVFLARGESGPIVKLLDFGGRANAVSQALTQTMVAASYASPELRRGLDVDPRCDVWSLAVIAYEMITGHHYIPSVSLKPRALDDVFRRAFHPSIDSRHQNVLAFAEALRASAEKRKTRVPEKRPSQWWIAIPFVIVILALLVFGLR